MSLEVLFRQIHNIRETIDIPLILMGYLNPVLNFGFEDFCRKASSAGIDGMILPDLPVEEYDNGYREICEKYGLYMIFLITPQTGEERINRITALSRGFVYMVSAASTTGAKQGFRPEQIDYFNRIGKMDIPLPRLIGFGISSAETFKEACKYANGAIIGSAFMKALTAGGDLEKNISVFIRKIR
jgi:tryptophan synthase alpha chain